VILIVELRLPAHRRLYPAARRSKLIEARCAGVAAFEPWMDNAPDLVGGAQFEKADVICVSGVYNVALAV